jgi:cation:H+ antiporter
LRYGRILNGWIELLGGGVLLYFGAEWLVGGASALALALRVAPLLVGLTVVAYGTSAPEVIVGIQAAAAGHGGIAFGNVVGSNIANIGLILGVSVLVRPARVSGQLRRRELPVLLASALLLPLLFFDGAVSIWEAILLLVAAAAYTGSMVAQSLRSAPERREARRETRIASDVADLAGAPASRGPLRSAVVTAAGLLVLVLGGHLFIDGAVNLAQILGVSDRVVGLTVVAVGTSIPELVTSVVASWRGHSDIAVGNVVGSNIFNVLLCLGAAALAGTVRANLRDVALDITVLILMTGLVVLFLRSERRVSRMEGAIALGSYVAFTVFVVLRQ